MNIRLLISVFILAFLVASCGENANLLPTTSSDKPEILEPKIEGVTEEFSVQVEKINNCDGMNSTTILKRSLAEGQTEGFEVTVEAGSLLRGSPIPSVLESELNTKLMAKLIRERFGEKTKEVEVIIETPRGQVSKHTIIWREKKVKGSIDVLFPGNSIPGSVSFSRLVSFELEDRTSEVIACNGGTLPTELPPQSMPPIEQTLPPTETPSTIFVTPTPSNQTKDVITVWGSEENGIRYDVINSGLYELSYLGDAYSPWANESQQDYRGWTTIVRIYINRPIEWGLTEYGLVGPINQDDYLGPGGYYGDINQAIAVTRGDNRKIRLNAGDYLLLVPLDEKGRYSDNRGKVEVGISMIGN